MEEDLGVTRAGGWRWGLEGGLVGNEGGGVGGLCGATIFLVAIRDPIGHFQQRPVWIQSCVQSNAALNVLTPQPPTLFLHYPPPITPAPHPISLLLLPAYQSLAVIESEASGLQVLDAINTQFKPSIDGDPSPLLAAELLSILSQYWLSGAIMEMSRVIFFICFTRREKCI